MENRCFLQYFISSFRRSRSSFSRNDYLNCLLSYNGRTSKSLFLILGRSSVVEVPVHVKRWARRQNMYIIASLKHACTSTTEDRPSIRNKLFAFLPVIILFIFNHHGLWRIRLTTINSKTEILVNWFIRKTNTYCVEMVHGDLLILYWNMIYTPFCVYIICI